MGEVRAEACTHSERPWDKQILGPEALTLVSFNASGLLLKPVSICAVRARVEAHTEDRCRVLALPADSRLKAKLSGVQISSEHILSRVG